MKLYWDKALSLSHSLLPFVCFALSPFLYYIAFPMCSTAKYVIVLKLFYFVVCGQNKAKLKEKRKKIFLEILWLYFLSLAFLGQLKHIFCCAICCRLVFFFF